ncbi:MAG: L-aspartate oxidase [Cellvibrionales bacterium]|nr:L-aspartate oxidase [Cellvibrionales bacterium]
MNEREVADVLVIGSGAAGLCAALHLAKNQRVCVLSKTGLFSGSTYWAQGGIAAVLDHADSLQAHVEDTLVAGAGLCHVDTVEKVVAASAAAVRWLVDMGVAFSPAADGADAGVASPHLTREAGHRHRRIVHSDDATGRALSRSLAERVREARTIRVCEQQIAVDLVVQGDGLGRRCAGAYVLDLPSGRVRLWQARAVILATGGASKVYLYSTNPDGASGDGIAMAWRAGCRVANMEFNQFHPTCLFHPQARSLLLSEALRGEGAHLTLPDGTRFMHRFHPDAELAPRDVVARAIDHEMKRTGCDHLLLDISHKPAEFVRGHFPNIHRRCAALGLDMTREPLPVVPAAHYSCGGVWVDGNGQTDLRNLYAIGEVAFTGMHGACRLAGNSLSECLVYARLAAEDIARRIAAIPPPAQARDWDETRVTSSDEDVVIAHNWDELRRFMWDYVGIVRTDKRLRRARHRIDLLQREIQEFYSRYRVTRDLIELRNLAVVAERIIVAASERKESRGLHYSLDYPQPLPVAKDSLMTPPNFAGERNK